MSDITLLHDAFAAVPEPSESTVAAARAALLRLITDDVKVDTAVPPRPRPNHAFSLPGRLRLDRPLRESRSRLRVVVVALLLLFLLAGIATATYLGVRSWVSAGPRGIQHVSGYRFTSAFLSPPATFTRYSSFALSPSGHDLYAIRAPYRTFHGRWRQQQVLVRIRGIDSGKHLPETIVRDVRSLAPRHWIYWPLAGPITVAANGDVFLVISGVDHLPGRTGRERLGHQLLVVVHRNGSHQLVLTGHQIVRARLFPPDWMHWTSIAATAPNRVWMSVDPYEGNGPQRLIEVVDPNADGNWSDRVVRAVTLPASVPFARASRRLFWSHWTPVWRWQLAADPSLSGNRAARSVLAAATSKGGIFRVYRISDLDDDGDALDGGELQLLFERHGSAWQPQLAAGTVGRRGKERLQFAVAGLTRPDRLSLIFSGTRVVKDIGRAFPGFSGVLAGSEGRVYPISLRAGKDGTRSIIYRLEPARSPVAGAAAPDRAAAVLAAAVVLPRSSGSTLTFSLGDSIYTLNADGRHLRRLVRAANASDPCQSADGKELAFRSDTEIPYELFTYVAREGERPHKVMEAQDQFACPFATDWFLLVHSLANEATATLERRDLRTGREAVVAHGVSGNWLSPDGRRVAYVQGTLNQAGILIHPTFELADLKTLQHRHLASPNGSGAELGSVTWSPDSKRIAYYTGTLARDPWALVRHRVVLWVRDATTGKPVLRLPTTGGGRPTFSWSADGTRLLVCIEDRGWQPACPATGVDGAIDVPHATGRLLFVDLRYHSSRVVAHGRLGFAALAPSGETFVYAIKGKLYSSTPNGAVRELATVPDVQWQHHLLLLAQPWLGWSPDGRYIGLGIVGQTVNRFAQEKGIPVIEVTTGKLRVLHPLGRAYYTSVRWWH